MENEENEIYNNMALEYQLVCSYLLLKYYVSTAYRYTNIFGYGTVWYFETIIWEWDSQTKERTNVIYTCDSGSNAIDALNNHNYLLRTLFRGKELDEKELVHLLENGATPEL